MKVYSIEFTTNEGVCEAVAGSDAKDFYVAYRTKSYKGDGGPNSM